MATKVDAPSDTVRPLWFSKVILGFLMFALLVQVGRPQGLIWHSEDVDTAGNVGMYSSLAISSDGVPWIAYYDATNADLKVAHREGSSWVIEVVDSVGSVGEHCSLAISPSNVISIAYFDASNGHPKFAQRLQSGWQSAVVDPSPGVGRYTRLKFGSNGRPQVVYTNSVGSWIRIARFDEFGEWITETVPGTTAPCTELSFDISSSGEACIAYASGNWGFIVLRLVQFSNGFWINELVDSTSGNTGRWNSLVLSAGNTPNIAYLRDQFTKLFVAERISGSWTLSHLFPGNTLGVFSSIAISPSGHVGISTGTASANYLYFLQKSGPSWTTPSQVDGTLGSGAYTSLVFDQQSLPTISYYNQNTGDLRFAFGAAAPKVGNDEEGWVTIKVPDNLATGFFTGGTVDYFVSATPVSNPSYNQSAKLVPYNRNGEQGYVARWLRSSTPPVVADNYHFYYRLNLGLSAGGTRFVTGDYVFKEVATDLGQANETDSMGVPPARALIGNGNLSAGFSKDGRMVNLFYPYVGAYDQLPYWTTQNSQARRYGAPEHLGAFLGIVDLDAEGSGPRPVHWLTNATYATRANGFDMEQRSFEHDTEFPAFTFHFDGKISADVTVYATRSPNGTEPSSVAEMLSQDNAIVYSVRLRNLDPELDGRHIGLAFYANFDPNKTNQNPYVFMKNSSDPLPLIGWKDNDAKSTVTLDNENLFWSNSATGNDQIIGVTAALSFKWADAALSKVGFDTDENGAFDPTSLDTNNLNTPIMSSSLVEGETLLSATEPWGMNAVMVWDVPNIPTNGETNATVYVALGHNQSEIAYGLDLLKNQTEENLRSNTIGKWDLFLSDLRINPLYTNPNLSDQDRKDMDWWAMTLRLMADYKSGAIIASPTVVPKYYSSWPRDGAAQSLAWLQMGYPEVAGKFLRFVFDHSDFSQNYTWPQCFDSSLAQLYTGFPFGHEPELGLVQNEVIEQDQMAWILLLLAKYIGTPGHQMNFAQDWEKVRNLVQQVISSLEPVDRIVSSVKPFPNQVAVPISIRGGITKVSSDSYEYPGEFASDLLRLAQPMNEQDPDSCAARQSSYSNFVAISAIAAASNLGNLPYTQMELLRRASDLRYGTEVVFWNKPDYHGGSNEETHFSVAWDIFRNVFTSQRIEDLDVFQAFPGNFYPRGDIHSTSHWTYVENRILQAPGPVPGVHRFFGPRLLYTDAYRKQSGLVPLDPLHPEGYLGRIRSEMPEYKSNGYVPESVNWTSLGSGYRWTYRGVAPLGWSQAAAIMCLFAAPVSSDITIPVITRATGPSSRQGTATVSVQGSGFMNSSIIYFDDTPIATSRPAVTQLFGTIPRKLLRPGSHKVRVFNPWPGGFSKEFRITIW